MEFLSLDKSIISVIILEPSVIAIKLQYIQSWSSSVAFLRSSGGISLFEGISNHIKAFKLHLLQDQREMPIDGPYS